MFIRSSQSTIREQTTSPSPTHMMQRMLSPTQLRLYVRREFYNRTDYENDTSTTCQSNRRTVRGRRNSSLRKKWPNNSITRHSSRKMSRIYSTAPPPIILLSFLFYPPFPLPSPPPVRFASPFLASLFFLLASPFSSLIFSALS